MSSPTISKLKDHASEAGGWKIRGLIIPWSELDPENRAHFIISKLRGFKYNKVVNIRSKVEARSKLGGILRTEHRGARKACSNSLKLVALRYLPGHALSQRPTSIDFTEVDSGMQSE